MSIDSKKEVVDTIVRYNFTRDNYDDKKNNQLSQLLNMIKNSKNFYKVMDDWGLINLNQFPKLNTISDENRKLIEEIKNEYLKLKKNPPKKKKKGFFWGEGYIRIKVVKLI